MVTIYNVILSGAYDSTIGMWLSLVERTVRDREVAGSNPVIPTIYTIYAVYILHEYEWFFLWAKNFLCEKGNYMHSVK